MMEREYKDSGIEWIGKIPEDFNLIKFKYIFQIIGGCGFKDIYQGDAEGDYPFCKASDINGEEVYVSTAKNWVSKELAKSEKYNIIPKGSILISKIGEALKKNHRKINTRECIVDNNCEGFANKTENKIIMLYYILKCIDMSWFDNQGTIPSINNEKLKNTFFPLPPLSEQQRIASYLDEKCGEIDSLIALQEQMIEKLKAYKQSVITEAVTKGLDPNAKLVPSGIDWIGEIPSHWNIIKVGFIFDNLDNLREPISAEMRERNNPQYDYYGATGVIDKIDHYNVDDKVLLIGEDGANLVMRNLPLIYKAEGKFWVNNHAHILKPRKDDYDFMAHTLEACNYRDYITGSAQPKLSQENLSRVQLPVPPLSEQQTIAAYLDSKCSDIDRLIALKQQKIEALKNYKKSVIYEAVTGKISVKC